MFRGYFALLMHIFAPVACVLAAALAAGLPGGVVSALLSLAAVVLPQLAAFALIMRDARANIRRFWSVRFSLTLLFLFCAASVLRDAAMLAAPLFVGGVVAGLWINIACAAHFSRRLARAAA